MATLTPTETELCAEDTACATDAPVETPLLPSEPEAPKAAAPKSAAITDDTPIVHRKRPPSAMDQTLTGLFNFLRWPVAGLNEMFGFENSSTGQKYDHRDVAREFYNIFGYEQDLGPRNTTSLRSDYLEPWELSPWEEGYSLREVVPLEISAYSADPELKEAGLSGSWRKAQERVIPEALTLDKEEVAQVLRQKPNDPAFG